MDSKTQIYNFVTGDTAFDSVIYWNGEDKRINYDLLSYLPESLETVEGQDVMVDEYGMGAFAMVVVEDTDMKDIQKLADQFNKVIMSKKYYGMVMWQIFHCR